MPTLYEETARGRRKVGRFRSMSEAITFAAIEMALRKTSNDLTDALERELVEFRRWVSAEIRAVRASTTNRR